MHSEARNLHLDLMVRSPVLPANLLRAVHTAASATQDITILTVLAGRDDLPDDILAELVTHTDPKVAAAIQARPQRPDQYVTATPEARHGVLAKAIGRYGTPPAAAFAAGVAAYTAKPSRVLFQVLWHRPATWFTPEQAAAVVAGFEMFRQSRNDGLFNMVARCGPDNAAKLLTTVDDERILDKLLGFPVPVDAVVAMATRLLRTPDRRASVSALLTGALGTLGPQDRRTVADAVLPVALEVGDKRAADVLRKAETYYQLTPGSWDTTPQTPPVSPHTTGDDDAVAAMATSPDPAVLATVLATMVTAGRIYDDAAGRLLRNPALPVDLRHDTLRFITTSKTVHRRLRDLDVIRMFPGDDVARELWTRAFPASVLARHGWAPFGGQDCAAQVIATWPTEAHQGSEQFTAAADAGLTRENLLDLPMPALRAIARPDAQAQTSGRALVCDQLARLLADRLGDDPQAWSTYMSLVDTYTGPLRGLFDTVTALSAH